MSLIELIIYDGKFYPQIFSLFRCRKIETKQTAVLQNKKSYETQEKSCTPE